MLTPNSEMMRVWISESFNPCAIQSATFFLLASARFINPLILSVQPEPYLKRAPASRMNGGEGGCRAHPDSTAWERWRLAGSANGWRHPSIMVDSEPPRRQRSQDSRPW